MASSFLNNYFGFNKQQRNGLLVLSLISLTLLFVRIIYPLFITPDLIEIKNLPLVEKQIDSSYKATQNNFARNFSEEKGTVNLFVFNPNTVNRDQLLQLGFKEKTVTTFLKFRDKGFVFKQKTDLKKVYGISDNFYSKLEPYILIDNKTNTSQINSNQRLIESATIKKQNKTQLDLNTADSLALIELEGIGPAFAKRILKYRSLLGGFVAVEQLKEVYGFTNEMFEKLQPFVTVNLSQVKKIDLNKDDFKSINKHPYLSYELTKTLFDWRRKTVITATNLKEIINDNSVYNKLLPYLAF